VDLSYSQVLPFPREEVWAALLDFGVLARVVPGIERLAPIGDDKCEMVVNVGVPLVTGTYRGTMELVEKEPFNGYRLRGDARGRLGWVSGEAGFRLIERERATELQAEVSLRVGGVLGAVGQRMMEGIAKGMARDFFAALEGELGHSKGPSKQASGGELV
jgi:carbon monoxide dehydrogenase subunit G